MRKLSIVTSAGLLLALTLPAVTRSQTTQKPDLSKQPTLYVIGYAHLDTEWRWEYPQVIDEYFRKTLQDNFKLFEKYPHYTFNFSGANRYRLIRICSGIWSTYRQARAPSSFRPMTAFAFWQSRWQRIIRK